MLCFAVFAVVCFAVSEAVPTNQQMVIAFEPNKNDKLHELRSALGVAPNKKSSLGQDLAETLKYLDEVEKAQMDLLGSVMDKTRAGKLKAQALTGTQELKNRTRVLSELVAADALLQSQRERSRSERRQNHQALVRQEGLSRGFMRSSSLETGDKINAARHQALIERLKSNADVRDEILGERGQRYEEQQQARNQRRNNLQSARAELLNTSLKANAAVSEARRAEWVKRRIERLNRLAKAREAYAQVMAAEEE